jgi:hypothetical protein
VLNSSATDVGPITTPREHVVRADEFAADRICHGFSRDDVRSFLIAHPLHRIIERSFDVFSRYCWRRKIGREEFRRDFLFLPKQARLWKIFYEPKIIS